MIFGTFVPQGWKTELAGIEDPRDKWATVVEVAVQAEQLGYDSVWVYDHVHNVPVPAHEAMFECWMTMAAISQRTTSIRLGQMVGCALYRSPALLAKMVADLDVMSGGRVDWGIGAGWYEHEYRAYGYGDEWWRGRDQDWVERGVSPEGALPSARDRIRMLRETVEIVTTMWSEADTEYQGEFFTVRGAQCEPKPLQQPRPPIWIGGAGEQLTLRVVARYADRSNFGGKPDEFAHKNRVLDEHCAAVGRDPAEIVRTWSPEVFVRESEDEIVAGGTRSFWGEPFESWREGNLVGTPEQVVEKIRAYQALGCGGLVPWFSDLPGTESMTLFAEQVMPELR